MLRPLESHDQSLIAAKLVITPDPPEYPRDAATRSVTMSTSRASPVAPKSFGSRVPFVFAQTCIDVDDFDIEEFARTCPFIYGVGGDAGLGPFR